MAQREDVGVGVNVFNNQFIVTFTREDHDTSNSGNPATGIYVIPATGIYQAHCGIVGSRLTSTMPLVSLSVAVKFKSLGAGGPFLTSSDQPNGRTLLPMNVSGAGAFKAGDELTCQVYIQQISSTLPLPPSLIRSSFSVQRLQ